MIVNAKQIIANTKNVFSQSAQQQKKFLALTEFVNEKDYKDLHRHLLTPTSIKFNTVDFLEEIKAYNNYFVQWGKNYSYLPRYGAALVNQDGILDKSFDPINGSLYEYNANNPESPLIESDCQTPTEIMSMPSLEPLRILDGYWYRSNILKWGQTAEFVPHIDNVIPAPWIRLWATMGEGVDVDFYDEETGCLLDTGVIEPGRLYIIDTSVVHSAVNRSEQDVYQLFLCVKPTALNILKSLI